MDQVLPDLVRGDAERDADGVSVARPCVACRVLSPPPRVTQSGIELNRSMRRPLQNNTWFHRCPSYASVALVSASSSALSHWLAGPRPVK